VIDLPTAESAIDLPRGPIAIGKMVNVTLLPGAWIEFVPAGATSAAGGR
jgi:hypothetical protein